MRVGDVVYPKAVKMVEDYKATLPVLRVSIRLH